jgi:hypothetical protein
MEGWKDVGWGDNQTMERKQKVSRESDTAHVHENIDILLIF